MNIKKTSSLLWGIGLIIGLLLILTLQHPQVTILDESQFNSTPDSFDVRYSYSTRDPIAIGNNLSFDLVVVYEKGN